MFGTPNIKIMYFYQILPWGRAELYDSITQQALLVCLPNKINEFWTKTVAVAKRCPDKLLYRLVLLKYRFRGYNVAKLPPHNLDNYKGNSS